MGGAVKVIKSGHLSLVNRQIFQLTGKVLIAEVYLHSMLAVSSTLGLRCQGLSPALLLAQVIIPLQSDDGVRFHNVS